MKLVEGTLAGVREKTTEVLTEVEQTVNNDSVRYITNPDDDCDRDCEHCEEHSTHAN